MTGMWKQWTLLLLGFVPLAAAAPAAADPPRVLSVLTVKVKGDQDAYLQKVKQFTALAKRLDAGGTTRVWRSTLAGDGTGLIFVATEYANLETLAKGNAKIQADEEWKKLSKDVTASGIRELVSNSLFEEVTP